MLGLEVEPWLRSALGKDISLEMRRRILQALDGLPSRSAKEPRSFGPTQAMLTITILEQLDTAESRATIAALANETPHSEIGGAAKTALQRLKK
jgi:hypothetical protein